MKIRNRRKCLDYQMNTKEILEYPFFPLGLKLNVPTIFFFTLFSASMQQNDLMNCTGMQLVIPKQVHNCVHTNLLSPSYFVSPTYYVSSTNCLLISAFNVKLDSTCGGHRCPFVYTLFLLLSPDQAKILIFSFSAVKIFI